ncbi:MAG: TetR/AcrR family transcriptional regulator [Pseudomonadota bacterium]
MVDKPTRKERERIARSDLFLDIARSVVKHEGFHELSMNRIAEIAEYSKGTIYLHFPSREMVLMSLCQRGLGTWQGLVDAVCTSELNTLEKLIGLHWAQQIYAALHPVEYDALFLVQASSIREKITKEAHASLNGEIDRMVQNLTAVVDHAVDVGEIVLPSDMTAASLGRDLWQMLAQPRSPDETAALMPAGISDPGHPGDRAILLRTLYRGLNGSLADDQTAFSNQLIDVRDRLFEKEMSKLNRLAQ